MQCVTCHQYITPVSDGFAVCPRCNTVNIPEELSKPQSVVASKDVLAPPHTVKPGRITKQKLWALISISAIFTLMITGGILANQLISRHKQGPSVVQTKDWQTEDDKLKAAQKLFAENKLDEATITLAQIDKDYPRYAEVTSLQKLIEAKKAETANQNAAKQSDNPKSAPKKPSSNVAPAPSSVFATPVQIRGDADCQSNTIEALKLLSQKAPTHYATVTKYVGVIECTSQGSGMFAYENPPRYLVGDATRNAGTVWYAGTIAHDAGHSQLYHTYLNAHPASSVPNDIWTGEGAEKTCLEAQYDALSKIGGTQTQLDYVRNVISSQYYNVSYEDRWW